MADVDADALVQAQDAVEVDGAGVGTQVAGYELEPAALSVSLCSRASVCWVGWSWVAISGGLFCLFDGPLSS